MRGVPPCGTRPCVGHCGQLPFHLACNVKGIFTIRHFLSCVRNDAMRTINEGHALPIRIINFFASLTLKPLPCILSSRFPGALRGGRAPPMGGNGRRKEVTKDLKVSLRVIQFRSLTSAVGGHRNIDEDLISERCRIGICL